MSNEILPANQPLIPTRASGGRLAKRTAQTLSQIDQSTEIALAKIEAAAEVQAGKISAATRVAAHAMQATGMLAAAQQQIALASPTASGNLDYLSTIATMTVGQIVLDTGQAVNRR